MNHRYSFCAVISHVSGAKRRCCNYLHIKNRLQTESYILIKRRTSPLCCVSNWSLLAVIQCQRRSPGGECVVFASVFILVSRLCNSLLLVKPTRRQMRAQGVMSANNPRGPRRSSPALVGTAAAKWVGLSGLTCTETSAGEWTGERGHGLSPVWFQRVLMGSIVCFF